jgi:hypothetical protein
MLFITYWELNENLAVSETLQAANKLTSSGLFPPENVQILRWDVTPDNWGILLVEADSAQAVNDAISMWRATTAGFFKFTKTAPALPVQEAIPSGAKILERLASI